MHFRSDSCICANGKTIESNFSFAHCFCRFHFYIARIFVRFTVLSSLNGSCTASVRINDAYKLVADKFSHEYDSIVLLDVSDQYLCRCQAWARGRDNRDTKQKHVRSKMFCKSNGRSRFGCRLLLSIVGLVLPKQSFPYFMMLNMRKRSKRDKTYRVKEIVKPDYQVHDTVLFAHNLNDNRRRRFAICENFIHFSLSCTLRWNEVTD